jgi:hypothetical protein
MVPGHLRNELPLDATPALDVHDKRIKAVFAMAPGIIQADARERAYVPAIHVFAVENKTWTRMTRAIFLFG